MSNTTQMSGHIDIGSAITGYAFFLISNVVINTSEVRQLLIGLLGAIIYAVVGWHIRRWLDLRREKKNNQKRKKEWEDKAND